MKVKFGSIITDGRGHLGGHVYSKNHWGNFARTKVTPANPMTGAQTFVRSNFKVIQFAWKGLSVADQALWQAATIDYPKTDFSGTVYFLTGYNLFIMLNIPFLRYTGGLMTVPPTNTIPTTDLAGVFTGSFFGGALTYDFDVPVPNDGYQIQISMTRTLSNGVNYVSTELRIIDTQVEVGQGNIDLYTPWTLHYGLTVPSSGQAVFLKLQVVNHNTGDYGIPLIKKFVEP